jgi:anti-anti-sigma factor
MASTFSPHSNRVTERACTGAWVSFIGHVRHGPSVAGMVTGQQLASLFEGRASGTVYLDLEHVTNLHAGEVGKVVEIWKRLKDERRRLVLCNVHPFICEVLSITRLDTLMEVRAQAAF